MVSGMKHITQEYPHKNDGLFFMPAVAACLHRTTSHMIKFICIRVLFSLSINLQFIFMINRLVHKMPKIAVFIFFFCPTNSPESLFIYTH